MTHTYAILDVNPSTWNDIAARLREAGYDHAFMEDGEIDMHGIAVKAKAFCKAQPTADPPSDCDWPACGCDPAASAVVEALQEQGKL
jgi:hypothetical protein